jgi:deoxycytidylate deaminase
MSRISGSNPPFVDSEIVLGLVAPVGTNFGRFINILERSLRAFGYQPNVVRLSALTENFETEQEGTDGTSQYVHLNELMHAGNSLRLHFRKGELLALAAAQAISLTRNKKKGRVRLHTAHVIRSLKHPDEVRALRRIYGPGFYLIGLFVDEEERRTNLRDDRGCTSEEVDRLIKRDEHEEDERYIENNENYGQRTRDTFHLSDFFVRLDDDASLSRFLNLIFGCPFETPTPDEYAMHLAFGAALRSGDLSRQVGAVITSAHGDLVAVGANDVPRRGGGLYWPGESDDRDHKRGEDSNEIQREKIVAEILTRLCPAKKDTDEAAAWISSERKKLRGCAIMDITEYGRAVHAELEALLSCARSGTSTRGATLFSTTFPCHNCAKHIIDAGISRVVYVEPYPKSKAQDFYSDSIVLGKEDPDQRQEDRRVEFEPFLGVGPRRFNDLFSLGLSSGSSVKRKKAGGKRIDWTAATGVVRIPMLPNSYLQRESLAEQELLALTAESEDTNQ